MAEDLAVAPAVLPGLAGALNDGAAALDAAGAGAPGVPDAGISTALVADGFAGLADALGALTAAIEACAAGVSDSAATYDTVEARNTAGFGP